LKNQKNVVEFIRCRTKRGVGGPL